MVLFRRYLRVERLLQVLDRLVLFSSVKVQSSSLINKQAYVFGPIIWKKSVRIDWWNFYLNEFLNDLNDFEQSQVWSRWEFITYRLVLVLWANVFWRVEGMWCTREVAHRRPTREMWWRLEWAHVPMCDRRFGLGTRTATCLCSKRGPSRVLLE